MNFRTVLAAAIFLAAAENVTASILVFEPSSQTVSGSFSVDVLIDDGVDLYAWNFDISFDGTILQATSVIEGAFLQTGGSTIFLQGTIDNSAGMISFIGDSLQGLIPGVSGTNGVLATVNFEIASYGVSPLGLSNILLLDSNLDEIESSGTGGSLTAVPEPGTGGLWVLGGLVLAACAARRKRAIAAAGLAAALGLVPARAADIPTAQVDSTRTGANPSEVYLTTSNLNVTNFGKLFTRAVDGAIYAQPLYLQGLTIGGVKRNVVYVATSHNKVYAFDADSAGASTALWMADLGTYDTVSGWNTGLGIISTPVIVRSSNALYVVAATKESGNRVYRLHALDITTGAAKFGSPAVISGSVLGSAGDAVGGVVTFNANKQLQRTGLAAAGASIVIAFSGDRDHGPYHGWVFAYHATTLAGTGVFSAARNNSTANGEGNGIWQSGRAPAVDGSGAVYLETGNGPYDGANDFGESFLKLTPGSSSLSLSDWFTPSNWSSLNTYDFDLGSTGPTVIPGSNLVFGGSKTGAVFLLATGNLGQLSPGNTNIAQEFLATSGCQAPLALQGCAQIMGHVFWATASTPILYVWGVHDVPRAYNFSSNRFVTTARDTGSLQATYPGGVLGLSSYQGVAGTGILWAITNETPDNGFYFGPGFTGTARLRAYDATNLASELWNSGQNVLRDDIGTFASFALPTIANGKVYVPTFSDKLVVYGLLSGPVSGDVNGDSTVNCADIAIVKAAYGKSSGQTGYDLRADVNGDGVVNILDLATVSRRVTGAVCN